MRLCTRICEDDSFPLIPAFSLGEKEELSAGGGVIHGMGFGGCDKSRRAKSGRGLPQSKTLARPEVAPYLVNMGLV